MKLHLLFCTIFLLAACGGSNVPTVGGDGKPQLVAPPLPKWFSVEQPTLRVIDWQGEGAYVTTIVGDVNQLDFRLFFGRCPNDRRTLGEWGGDLQIFLGALEGTESRLWPEEAGIFQIQLNYAAGLPQIDENAESAVFLASVENIKQRFGDVGFKFRIIYDTPCEPSEELVFRILFD